MGEEYTLALATDFILSENPGPVVVNASTSMIIDAIAEKYCVEVYRTKIGEIHVSTKMKEIHAVIGGEGNGGVILPEIHYGRDAVTGIAIILQYMIKTQKTVSEIKKSLPDFFIIKHKVDVKDIDTAKIIQKIKKDFRKYRFDETDGIKVLFDRSWVQLRKSNTEPIIRIMAEAQTEDEAKKLINSFTSFFNP
jgi:phosphomannomutase